MSLTDGLESYICIILTIEFVYDYYWNTRENRIKRRKENEKKKGKSVDTPPLPSSGGTKNVALESGPNTSSPASKALDVTMEM